MNIEQEMADILKVLENIPTSTDGLILNDDDVFIHPKVVVEIVGACGRDIALAKSIISDLQNLGEVGEQTRAFESEFHQQASVIKKAYNDIIRRAEQESSYHKNGTAIDLWRKETWRSHSEKIYVSADKLKELCRFFYLEKSIKGLNHLSDKSLLQSFPESVKLANEAANVLEKRKNEANEILEKLQRTDAIIGRTGLIKSAIDELDKIILMHRFIAFCWAAGMALGVACTIWLLMWVYSDDLHFFGICGAKFKSLAIGSDGAGLLANAISRLVVVSVGVSITLLAFRMYQNHMHNLIVNRHRRLSISIFEYLQDALASGKVYKDGQDYLLMQATQTILHQGNSGFLSSKDENILPIIKTMTDLAKAARVKE